MTHSDRQVGVPRNIIARWLSETKNVQNDFERLKQIPLSRGYNHIFTNTKGEIFDIECSTTKQVLLKPASPYAHSNHFLSEDMKSFEASEDATGTIERYTSACALVKPQMTAEEIIQLNSNSTNGDNLSVFNKRTIGKMVFDLENFVAKVWLKRENDLGWIDYKLDFVS